MDRMKIDNILDKLIQVVERKGLIDPARYEALAAIEAEIQLHLNNTYQGVSDRAGLVAVIERLTQRVAEVEKEQDGWVSVSERLPERDGSYLIYPEGKYYDRMVEFTVKGFTFDGDTIPPMSFYYTKDDSYGYTYSYEVKPEMWHNLPSLPKTEGE